MFVEVPLSLRKEQALTEERRRGSASSTTRRDLLDAAARLLEREGYASVTSRRVAAEAGLKPQLVHYYFRSMDDLFVALYTHVSEAFLTKLSEVAGENRALSMLWAGEQDAVKAVNTRMNVEFLALANHREPVRKAVQDYSIQYRKRELSILGRHAKALAGAPPPWTSTGIALLIEAVARLVSMDDAIGIVDGHAELRETFEAVMKHIESRLALFEPVATTS